MSDYNTVIEVFGLLKFMLFLAEHLSRDDYAKIRDLGHQYLEALVDEYALQTAIDR
jgi:hypothetical protein